MLRQPVVSFALAAFLMLTVSSHQAVAGQCRNETRLLQVTTAQSAHLRELSCRFDRNASATLHVQFQRLSEGAAGVLLNNGTAPWTSRVYGNATVLDNPVLRQYRELVGKFGTPVRTGTRGAEEPGGAISGEFGVVGLAQPQHAGSVGSQTVETFELPLRIDGPLVEEIQHILTQRTWPPSLQFQYSFHEIETKQSSLFDQLRVWRYLTRADVDRMERNLRRYNSLVGKTAREFVQYRTERFSKALPLLRYLIADGLPERFRHFSSTIGEGCFQIDFSLNWIEFAVDVAVLRNRSQQPISIGKFLGAKDERKGLRELSSGQNSVAQTGPLTAASTKLQPGESIVVPLRLVFGRSINEDVYRTVSAEQRQISEKRYRRIQATRPGTEFRIVMQTELTSDQRRGRQPDTYIVLKTRESFTPHSEPEERAHSFGPVWDLFGIEAAGEELSFVNPERDTIHFTVASGAGSCPILYAWSEHRNRWVKRGKVLHAAQGKTKLQTETVSFDGFVPRFLLSEEELEVAHISGLAASVVLDNGETIWLKLRLAGGVATAAALPISIYSDDAVEFALDLPDGISANRVMQTRLGLTGYYDRYSTVLLVRSGAQRQRTVRGDD